MNGKKTYNNIIKLRKINGFWNLFLFNFDVWLKVNTVAGVSGSRPQCIKVVMGRKLLQIRKLLGLSSAVIVKKCETIRVADVLDIV